MKSCQIKFGAKFNRFYPKNCEIKLKVFEFYRFLARKFKYSKYFLDIKTFFIIFGFLDSK